jgi:hypothetical protein
MSKEPKTVDVSDENKGDEKKVDATNRGALLSDDRRTRQERDEDRSLTEQRGNTAERNETRTDEAKTEQHRKVDEAMARRNEENREGHDKNMKRIEDEAKQIAEASEAHVPTGKQNNRNTPRIDKDGTKHWVD